jgi:hypothetical protein
MQTCSAYVFVTEYCKAQLSPSWTANSRSAAQQILESSLPCSQRPATFSQSSTSHLSGDEIMVLTGVVVWIRASLAQDVTRLAAWRRRHGSHMCVDPYLPGETHCALSSVDTKSRFSQGSCVDPCHSGSRHGARTVETGGHHAADNLIASLISEANKLRRNYYYHR